MKKNYRNLLLGIAVLMSTPAMTQVASYMFAQSNGSYTAITGGSVIATATANAAPGNLANMVWNLPTGTFPFPFVFNGISYTGCDISCNGYITFGTIPPTNSGSPISIATAYDGAIAAWGRTTYGAFNLGTTAPFHTSELRVEIIGAAPNRTVVIQYDKWRYSGSTTTTSWLASFQIRLIETTNVVEIVYGPGVMAGGSLTTSGFNCQVGLRGATNTDFNNRSSFGVFDQSTAGTANNASQVIGVTSGVPVFMPVSGLTYKWYPLCSGTPVTPTITVVSPTVCAGDTVKFTANGETPYFDIAYQWQQSTTPGGPYTNVSGPVSGTTFTSYNPVGNTGVLFYVLVTTCTNVPSTSTSNEIMVDVKPLPILDIFATPALNTSVTPIETCDGATYTLTASGAHTYTWVGGPTTDSFVVQPASNPSYTIMGTSLDGCFSSRTLDIQVNPLPTISILASPNSVCPGKQVVIAAAGTGITYTWVAENSNSFLINVTPTVSTIYTVMATAANGCTNVAMHQIAVHNVTQISAMSSVSSATICKGEVIELSASGAVTYTWATPGSYTLGQLIYMYPDVTTTYTVTGADLNGCTTQTTVSQSVSECVGLNETGWDNNLSVYPNPSNGLFTIELNNGADKTYDVLDMTGRIVLSTSTSNSKTELNISELANGIYHVRVQSNNSVQIIKVVKQ